MRTPPHVNSALIQACLCIASEAECVIDNQNTRIFHIQHTDLSRHVRKAWIHNIRHAALVYPEYLKPHCGSVSKMSPYVSWSTEEMCALFHKNQIFTCTNSLQILTSKTACTRYGQDCNIVSGTISRIIMWHTHLLHCLLKKEVGKL